MFRLYVLSPYFKIKTELFRTKLEVLALSIDRSFWEFLSILLKYTQKQVKYKKKTKKTELWNMIRLMTKPTKWCPAKTQMPSLIRVFAVRMKKGGILTYPLSTQWRLWSDWADAQADLRLRWAHSYFVGFDMRQLIFWWNFFASFCLQFYRAAFNNFSEYFTCINF